MSTDKKFIIEQFRIDGDLAGIEAYGSGHIHDTYVVRCYENDRSTRYILQRINDRVFSNPEMMMENIVRVTTHIQHKLADAGISDIERRVLTVVPTRKGKVYYKCEHGRYWRMYVFVENAQSYDTIKSLEKIYEAARMFGQFQNMLTDLEGGPLHETIMAFHDGPRRFRAFLEAVEADACNRAGESKAEIDFLQEHAWIFDILPKLVERGEIPVRITHNDTKINNILFDNDSGKGLCVIDLDTVMPGLALYDFGDIARTTISEAAEDEKDLSKVTIDLGRFEAIVRGYLSTAVEFLNKAECHHLVLGGMMMTLIMGARFLTDYLMGDGYYKIYRKGHNLDRCRTQFELVRLMREREDEMDVIVHKYLVGGPAGEE